MKKWLHVPPKPDPCKTCHGFGRRLSKIAGKIVGMVICTVCSGTGHAPKR